jgi:hypothetical protein
VSRSFKTEAVGLRILLIQLEIAMQRNHFLVAAWTAVAIATTPPLQARPLIAATEPEGQLAMQRQLHSPHCRGPAGTTAFVRTELFFGLSRPGGAVSEEEFKTFIDSAVTPSFPDGLTLLSGNGQFRDASGTIVAEGSKLLIVLVPLRNRDTEAKIEQIRSDYKLRFQQQSVLRADAVACVSF